jgi:hypothetical protein
VFTTRGCIAVFKILLSTVATLDLALCGGSGSGSGGGRRPKIHARSEFGELFFFLQSVNESDRALDVSGAPCADLLARPEGFVGLLFGLPGTVLCGGVNRG